MASSERKGELLAERAAQGLDVAGEKELAHLLGEDPERSREAAEWEAAAAAGALGCLGALEPMPEALARAVRAEGEVQIATAKRAARRRELDLTTNAGAASEVVRPARARHVSGQFSGARALPWGWLAAAAAVALLVLQTWRAHSATRAAAAAPLRVTCGVDGSSSRSDGELFWDQGAEAGVFVVYAAPAASSSAHVVYRCNRAP